MNLRRFSIITALVSLLAVGALAQGARIMINGKPAAHAPVVQNGETYVSLSDLKAAGAQVTVSGGQTSIRFRPDSGGAYQVAAVEGTRGEWLFNGIWRLKAGAVSACERPFSDHIPGWAVEIEVRNGSTKEVALHNTGVQLPTLALSDGTVLKADEGDWQLICFRQMLPGASVTHTLKFYFPHGTTSSQVKPAERLVVNADTKFGLLRDTGLHYTAGPAFRVSLK